MSHFDHQPSLQQREKWEAEQKILYEKVIWQNDDLSFDDDNLDHLKYIAGVDLSFPKNDDTTAIACLVVLSYPQLEVVYTDYLETELSLPYIPGLLAFREVAPLTQLLRLLNSKQPNLYPQIILVDGNGRLHPRQCGIACHLGVLTNTPTIGVAKNFLAIADEGPLLQMHHVKQQCKKALQQQGDQLLLVGSSTTVYGAAVRTSKDAFNPVFVSQGHRVDLATAVRVVLACCLFRIPEPIRQADQRSRQFIRNKQIDD